MKNQSRLIKFRVWDKKENRFRKLNDLGAIGSWFVLMWANPSFCENFIIQQFTGLKDKNGKEIYEGDIVKYSYYKETKDSFDWNGGEVDIYKEVKINFDYYGAYDPFTNAVDSEYGYSAAAPENCEIVGNIFENPELLK